MSQTLEGVFQKNRPTTPSGLPNSLHERLNLLEAKRVRRVRFLRASIAVAMVLFVPFAGLRFCMALVSSGFLEVLSVVVTNPSIASESAPEVISALFEAFPLVNLAFVVFAVGVPLVLLRLLAALPKQRTPHYCVAITSV